MAHRAGFLRLSASVAALMLGGTAYAQSTFGQSGFGQTPDPFSPGAPVTAEPYQNRLPGSGLSVPPNNSLPRPQVNQPRNVSPMPGRPASASQASPSSTSQGQSTTPSSSATQQPRSDREAAGLRSTLSQQPAASNFEPNAQQRRNQANPASTDVMAPYNRPSATVNVAPPVGSGKKATPSSLTTPMANRTTGRRSRASLQQEATAQQRRSSPISLVPARPTSQPPVSAEDQAAILSPGRAQMRMPQRMRGNDVPIIYEPVPAGGRLRPVANPIAPQTVIDPQTGQIRSLARPRPVVEVDPYAATGMTVGAFTLKPSIEVVTGVDDNPSRASGGSTASLFNQISTDTIATSNWQEHEMTVRLRGSQTLYYANGALNRPTLDASVGGRIDINRDTRAEVEARYGLSALLPGTSDLTANQVSGVSGLPLVHQKGFSLGVIRDIQRLQVSLRGTVDHYGYEATRFNNGGSQDNSDRNYFASGLKLRTSYEMSPALRPFVEVGYDNRSFEKAIDRNGAKSGSTAFNLRVGSQFELSRLLTGEVSVGYENRTPLDGSRAAYGTALTDASLIWAATPLTTVTLNAKTSADEASIAGVTAITRRDLTAKVDHAFRRWLIGSAQVGFGFDTYNGISRNDTRIVAATGLTYRFTRSLSMRGELRHERTSSSVAGNDYTANIALIGLRLQR